MVVIFLSLIYTGWARGLACLVEILVVTPLLILAALNKDRIFDSIVLKKLGESSYPIYLIHQNVGFMIELRICELKGWDYSVPTFAFTVVIIMGIIIFHLIEKPIQKMIRNHNYNPSNVEESN